jgi:hypothetical protein
MYSKYRPPSGIWIPINTTRLSTVAFCVSILLTLFLLLSVVKLASADPEEKVSICHVTGNGNEITLTLGEAALKGHFNESGTPREGGLRDYWAACGMTESAQNFIACRLGPTSLKRIDTP